MKTPGKKFFVFLFIWIEIGLPNKSIECVFGPGPVSAPNGLYQKMLGVIREARQSLFLAIHELELIEVAKLLVEKKQEGLSVQVLLEKKWTSEPENLEALDILRKGDVKVHLDRRDSGLMHNKYIVVDDRLVWTGSVNFTVNGFFVNYNDGIIIRHSKIAKIYRKNFYALVNPYYRNYSTYKRRPIRINEDETILPYFSRQGYSVSDRIVDRIKKSRSDIRFLIFAYSSAPIVWAMKQRVWQKVRVRGVFDNAFESENVLKNWKTIPFQTLWMAGAEVKYDTTSAKIHHKCMAIDDRIVITGSFNFSKNAEKHNDENLLIIESPRLTRAYHERFKTLWKQFPLKTPYEEFVKARRKDPSLTNEEAFYRRRFKERYRYRKKLLAKPSFNAKVVRVMAGDRFLVEEDRHRLAFTVKLYGVDAPETKFLSGHQEPQASYAKQFLNRLIGQRNISIEVVEISDSEILHGIVHLENHLGENSINEAMVKGGYAFIDPEYNDSRPTFGKRISQAMAEAQKAGEFLFQPENALDEMPFDFRQRMEKAQFQRVAMEQEISLSQFEKGCYIGNRKTGKFYSPGSALYLEYYKKRQSDQFVFFRSKEDALKCGYTEGRRF